MKASNKNEVSTSDQIAMPLTKGIQMLGIGLSYAYEMMNTGKLKTFKIGRRRMVTHEALQAFVAAQIKLSA